MKYKRLILTVLTLTIAGAVFAHSGATGVVKKRMDAMSDMGDRSKLVADMFKGKTEFDKAAIVDAADAFVMHGSAMTELFPDTKDSRTGSKTEALPAIWEGWDEFNEMVTEFVSKSETLQSTVSDTDDPKALKVAFFKTTKSCSGCHKRFRKPKD